MTPQPQTTPDRLPKKTLFFYGIADLPVMMAIMPMMLYLNRFYTGDMGLGLAAVANIMLFARVFDVVSDPLVGYLSDHTKTRWGRRRPWMAASLPFMMMGAYKVFLPPEGIDIWYLFTWMMVLWLGWTMLMIPYYAWAAEMSTDYDERTRITGWRAMMGSVGSLLAQVIPFLAMLLFSFGGARNVMTMVGLSFLVLIPICVLLTITMVKENPEIKTPPVPLFAGASYYVAQWSL